MGSAFDVVGKALGDLDARRTLQDVPGPWLVAHFRNDVIRHVRILMKMKDRMRHLEEKIVHANSDSEKRMLQQALHSYRKKYFRIGLDCIVVERMSEKLQQLYAH